MAEFQLNSTFNYSSTEQILVHVERKFSCGGIILDDFQHKRLLGKFIIFVIPLPKWKYVLNSRCWLPIEQLFLTKLNGNRCQLPIHIDHRKYRWHGSVWRITGCWKAGRQPPRRHLFTRPVINTVGQMRLADVSTIGAQPFSQRFERIEQLITCSTVLDSRARYDLWIHLAHRPFCHPHDAYLSRDFPRIDRPSTIAYCCAYNNIIIHDMYKNTITLYIFIHIIRIYT